MNKIVVSPTQKPVIKGPFEPHSYERGLDPWHSDAFKGIPGVESEIKDSGPRCSGWFGLDAWGNEIIFVPDGMEMDEEIVPCGS